ncbi:MAG: glycoside hydrolase family 3 N-terminal domain-containing protein [Clostridia bacterium]|jgi:beta-glucosidase
MDRYNLERRIKAEKWAEGKLTQMSLDEKLHQLAVSFPNGNERLSIPHMQQGECLHGAVTPYATSFPQALALGSTWDVQLIEQIASVIAKECRACGIHQCYGPMVAVVRDPRWGRIQEAYGEDAYHVSRIGLAFSLGLQGTGEKYLDKDHIVATAKHFVADGEPLGGLNGAAMEISERSLREVHLIPFETLVKEGHVCSVMPAHHSLNGIPCHSNRYLLQNILREEYGFDGIIVSDNGDIRKLHTALFVSDSPETSAVMAMNAGVDTELAWMVPWNENRLYGPVLKNAIEKGKINEETINKSVMRVLIKKYELGLIDDPTADPKQESLEKCYTDASAGKDHVSMAGKTLYFGKSRYDRDKVCYDKDHDKIALKAALKSIILLENKEKLLPLNKNSINRMAVIGPNADRLLLGNYSTDKPKYFISVLDGINNYAKGNFEVTYSQALDQNDYSKIDIPDAVKKAKDADITLLVLGGNETTCMENEDTDDLSLKGDQELLFEKVRKAAKKLVLLIIDGRPSSVLWAKEKSDAFLTAFYLGQECGNAVAMTLFGDYNPSAKLPVTIPRNVGQIQCHYNRFYPGRAPGYYNSPVEPLYPFGYGLSYTDFEISAPVIEEGKYTTNDEIPVSVQIRNIGDAKGEETVQLYIKDCIASMVRPVMELKRFRKVELEPGEKKTICFNLKPRDLAFWKDKKWVTEPGRFVIMSGNSSINLKETELIIE